MTPYPALKELTAHEMAGQPHCPANPHLPHLGLCCRALLSVNTHGFALGVGWGGARLLLQRREGCSVAREALPATDGYTRGRGSQAERRAFATREEVPTAKTNPDGGESTAGTRAWTRPDGGVWWQHQSVVTLEG